MSPIVDGHLIREDDRTSIATRRFLAIPMNVGTILNEGGGFARNSRVKTYADLQAFVAQTFPGSAEKAGTLYHAEDDSKGPTQLAALFGDTQYNFGSRELLRYGTRNNVPVYRFLFIRTRNMASAAPVHGAAAENSMDFGAVIAAKTGNRTDQLDFIRDFYKLPSQ